MNIRIRQHTFLSWALAILCGLGLMACNKKEEPTQDEEDNSAVINVPNVAVMSFSLKADKSVMNNLDSVFFSIDLEHGVIYNADSLPKDTKIDKLVPVIGYSEYITTATLTMEGGETRTGEVNYIEHPTDTIDFTGKTTLHLATANNAISKDYLIKINVHKEDPDSLAWSQIALAGLPSRLQAPVEQGSAERRDRVTMILLENDGTYTLSSSDDIYAGSWTKEPLALDFTPDISTFTASDEAFYMLDNSGKLYSSPDGRTWSQTGHTWTAMLGGYLNTVVGIEATPEGLFYAQYPLKDLNRKIVDQDFPLSGYSNMAVHANKWAQSPLGLICGGYTANGFTSASWGFDGREWVKLSSGNIPEVRGASLVSYYAFRNLSSQMRPTEMKVWFLIGGLLSDGRFNRKVYISYDNGVNWRLADPGLQLPEIVPGMMACDNVVQTHEYSTELSDAWKVMAQPTKTRASWSVEGDSLSWLCPYIYLIGGTDANGNLMNTIWRGGINRLRFAPII